MNQRRTYTEAEVQETVRAQEAREHPFQKVWNYPRCMQGMVLGFITNGVGRAIVKGGKPQAYANLVGQYLKLSYTMPNPLDTAQLLVQHPPGLAYHSLVGDDRLGGPQASLIPIGVAFGDQDVYQSEGAVDELIRKGTNTGN